MINQIKRKESEKSMFVTETEALDAQSDDDSASKEEKNTES
jgi:hypothetical protein